MESEIVDCEAWDANKGLAVDIQDVSYSYERGRNARNVLKDITMQVQQGTIYGLLGPSGCGKTTLLNCAIGLLSLKSGIVKVFGEKPGSKKSIVPGRGIGYMPQEHSLYPELSIWESLLYFGRLHRVSQVTIKERADLLLKFLDLPPKCSMVGRLSSGQQRRVSLAVALIHEPPLLILDEPTVGVDPVLRRCIWDHLVQLATQDGMTIIITTHYIEEARQANVVAFMRNGHILRQTNPLRELEEFHETTLEESFLRICKNNDKTSGDLEHPEVCFSNGKQPTYVSDKNSQDEVEMSPLREDATQGSRTFKTSMKNIFKTKMASTGATRDESGWKDGLFKTMAILQKNFTRSRRNIPLMIIQFVIPGFTMLLVAACLGQPPFDLQVAVVNEDKPVGYSMAYLESIDHLEIIQVPYPDLASAVSSVKNGKSWGIIHIPKNFSKYLPTRIAEGVDATNESIVGSNIHIYLDTTITPVSSFIQLAIFKSFQTFSASSYESMGLPAYVADFPIQFGDPIYGEKDHSFIGFLVPGVILAVSYTVALGLTTLTLVQERVNSLLERTWVCRVSSVQIIVAHLLSQFIVVLFQTFGTLLIVYLMLNVSFDGILHLAVLLTVLSGTCGMVLGLLLSGISTDPNVSLIAAIGHFFPIIILSGILWPLEGQPHWIRYISKSLPLAIPTAALRSIMNRGWGLEQTEVWSAVLVQLAWITAFILIAIYFFKLKK